MEFLLELWLPILLSSLAVFMISSVIHMVLPYHKSDFQELPGEAQAMDALGKLNIPPGDYYFPFMQSSSDMKSEAYKAKAEKGPVGFVTIFPNGMPSMGSNLAQWFTYSAVVGIFTAYIAYNAIGASDTYLEVFQITGAASFVGYALALSQQSIWYGKKWSSTFKSTFDGFIYALLTAGMFGWLWPGL